MYKLVSFTKLEVKSCSCFHLDRTERGRPETDLLPILELSFLRSLIMSAKHSG